MAKESRVMARIAQRLSEIEANQQRIMQALGIEKNSASVTLHVNTQEVRAAVAEALNRVVESDAGSGETSEFATGGVVSAGTQYIVGDSGSPEILVPRSSGEILPNDDGDAPASAEKPKGKGK